MHKAEPLQLMLGLFCGKIRRQLPEITVQHLPDLFAVKIGRGCAGDKGFL